MAQHGGISIPERGAPYDPIHSDHFMDFDAFLEFGDAEERWELIAGLPALPVRRNIGSNRMATHLSRVFRDLYSKSDEWDAWGFGAMVRIDDFNALIPSLLIEPRPKRAREWLICDPVLVVEASYGCETDRAALHERRAMYLSPTRQPRIEEYIVLIDSGPPRDVDGGHTPMNFVPFAGRMYVGASRARTVYRFRHGGQISRFSGDDEVELQSIGLTMRADDFFPGERD